VAARLTEVANIVSAKVSEKNSQVDLEVNDPNAFYDQLSRLVTEQQLPVLSFSSPDNNLESVFQYLVEG
jgi:hypothetical protein